MKKRLKAAAYNEAYSSAGMIGAVDGSVSILT